MDQLPVLPPHSEDEGRERGFWDDSPRRRPPVPRLHLPRMSAVHARLGEQHRSQVWRLRQAAHAQASRRRDAGGGSGEGCGGWADGAGGTGAGAVSAAAGSAGGCAYGEG
ncbi:uncharacterized protein LTR77_000036 [Saxophila tyrrhenica]|uniref:Uncharacterized protein n=1 Tax=Saxophila tyrrhenica TaxID=1690608 RepID=A0AAV9PMY2_9PEZI|nr:hypothetical protein LTR77_000036 [Saxophila tyrrhenica]